MIWILTFKTKTGFISSPRKGEIFWLKVDFSSAHLLPKGPVQVPGSFQVLRNHPKGTSSELSYKDGTDANRLVSWEDSRTPQPISSPHQDTSKTAGAADWLETHTSPTDFESSSRVVLRCPTMGPVEPVTFQAHPGLIWGPQKVPSLDTSCRLLGKDVCPSLCPSLRPSVHHRQTSCCYTSS